MITLQFFDVEVASNGNIWVGSSEGIFHKKGQNWSKYSKSIVLPKNRTFQMINKFELLNEQKEKKIQFRV